MTSEIVGFGTIRAIITRPTAFPMPALLLYCATVATLLAATGRWLVRITPRSALILAVLPLYITGRALLTGGVYGPIDLAYQTEPLASVAAQHGMTHVVNPMLTDVQRLMIPWKLAVRYAFAHGDWPLWNPFSFSGDILAAASEPSPWHPFHLLSYLLPFAQSITFHASMVLFAAALCAFILARELELGELPAIIAAAAWMLSTFMLFFAQVPLGLTVLLQPLLFVAVRRIVREQSFANVMLLTIALVLAVVAGHPESTLHVVALGVLYACFELLQRDSSLRRVRAIGAAAIAGVLALLLSAVHLLPVVDALPQTSDYQERSRNMTREDRSVSMKEARERLLADVLPFAFGSPASEVAHVPPIYREPMFGYAGSLLFAPALFALIRWRHRMRWFLLVLVVAGFLLGVSAPGISDLLARLPLFDIALNQRLVYAAVLALCILAGAGVDLWMRTRDALLPALTVATLIVMAAVMALQWLPLQTNGLSLPFLRAHAMVELVPLALCAALLLQRPAATWGAACFLVLLLLQRMPDENARTPTYPAAALYPATPLLAPLPEGGEPYRVVGVGAALTPNTNIHYLTEDPRGFHGMTFARLRRTLELWSRIEYVSNNVVDRLDVPFLNFLNVRFAVDRTTDALPDGWIVRKVVGEARLVENSRVVSRAFVPRNVTPVSTGTDLMMQLGSVTDFADRAWIEPTSGDASGQNGPGRIETRRDGTGLRLLADMQRDAWVVISETAWSGWRATIDGRNASLRIANGAFLAVRVPAGRHEVRLRYLPQSFIIGGMSTLTTLLALFALALWRGRARVQSALRARRRELAVAALLLASMPAFAAFPSKRLFVAAAGNVSSATGNYATGLTITNSNATQANLTITFLPPPNAGSSRSSAALAVPPNTTIELADVTATLLQRPGLLGALMIESDAAVAASARIATSDRTRSGALSAIPIELAIGPGESTTLHGAGSGGGRFRYNVHLVETNRYSSVVTLTVRDLAGREAGKRTVLLSELQSMTVPLHTITASIPEQATVQLEVTGGAGHVIASGSQVNSASGDFTNYEMLFPRRMETKLPRTEAVVWTAVAVALALSAIAALRRRS